jgi:hypothetical protein
MNAIQQIRLIAALLLAGQLSTAWLTMAQTPGASQVRHFTAVTDNVSGAKNSVRIDLVRLSTDAERDQLLAAWNLTPAPGRGGRGGGGRGRGAAVDPAPDPAAVTDPFGTFGTAAAAGRGGRGGAGAETPRQTPEHSLAAALGKVPTVGYLWSSEVAGYALHYAVRLAEQDGGERIVLITDRRLGASNDLWNPAGSAAATDYPFSVIELHLNPKGEGEGKVSLTGKVTLDAAAKTMGLDNYSALPVILRNVRQAAK